MISLKDFHGLTWINYFWLFDRHCCKSNDLFYIHNPSRILFLSCFYWLSLHLPCHILSNSTQQQQRWFLKGIHQNHSHPSSLFSRVAIGGSIACKIWSRTWSANCGSCVSSTVSTFDTGTCSLAIGCGWREESDWLRCSGSWFRLVLGILLLCSIIKDRCLRIVVPMGLFSLFYRVLCIWLLSLDELDSWKAIFH